MLIITRFSICAHCFVMLYTMKLSTRFGLVLLLIPLTVFPLCLSLSGLSFGFVKNN